MHVRAMRGFVYVTVLLSLNLFVGCMRDKDSGELRGLKWSDIKQDEDRGKTKKTRVKAPPDIAGTVGEYGTLVSSQAPVGGPGVVVGLGKKGSSEIPSNLQSRLLGYLNTLGYGLASKGTESVKPITLLHDMDTAVVRVVAVIPPGAPKGTRVDAFVSAFPRTQTTSLEGGLLLPTDLFWEQGATGKNQNLKTLAIAVGPIFVNPFIDPTKPGAKARFRQGRILNGMVVKKNMPLQLRLYKPNYHISRQIQERINYRFGQKGRAAKKVAVAKNPHIVDIIIPRRYAHDYEHFLELILHLPLQSGTGAIESKASEIARAMKKPDANYKGLSLVWEAMGRQVLPTIQRIYSSSIPEAAFYAARTGLRFDDNKLAGPIIMQFAADSKSPMQLAAIEALGKAPTILRAGQLLRNLVNSKNELVRVAAYEAMVSRKDWNTVKRYEIDKDSDGATFILDQVVSKGNYAIYATASGQPKIVLFGEQMPLKNPLFPIIPRDIVTIFNETPLTKEKIEKILLKDPQADTKLLRKQHVVIYRKIPGTEKTSARFRIPFRVWNLVRVLGSAPRAHKDTGRIQGLGFTYSQVVSIFHKLCEQNSIPAKFVLQRTPEIRKIYRDTSTTGRPDSPDH